MTETTQEQTGLAALLEERLIAWEQARKPQELKLLECYQDVMRIPREDDTAGTGAAKARKAKSLFIGSTRNKVRAARAKIVDALLGSGNMPFDTNPTNEQLAPFADVVEDIITEQMERGKYRDILKTGVNTLATYGTGFVFGPFVRKETLTETSANVIGASTEIIENKYEYDFPYFELGNTLDVYPDAESHTLENGLGCFWVTMESPHTVRAWKDDKSYSKISEALIGSAESSNETGSDRATQLRGNIEYWHKNNRIKVARFFGKVPARLLENEAADHESSETDEEERKESQMVDVVVIMAGGVVVKVDKSPYNKLPVQRCIYEAVEHEIWGVGVAENNAPHQKVTNAAFRLFMEGKGMALLGTKSVDRSKFLATEDFKKFPGKVYQMKPGLSPDERKDAIMQYNEPDVTGGWIDVIRMSENFSDDDTGITKYTQGDDSRNLNKTASGISMIMNASSLPIKEVIQNIDSMWIEEHVECFINWDLKYLEPETVEKIHGKEHAEKWAQIKQFGKSSFMDWQATGTASFMQKEVLTNKIRAFSEFALSNPATAQLIDVREMLQQTWDVMEIGKESPILEKDKAPSPEMQQAQEQIKAMGDALESAHKEVMDKEQQLKDRDREMTLKENIAISNANKKEADPNAVDQTAVAVANINAASAERIARIQAGAVKPEEQAEEIDEETGETIIKIDPMQQMLGALVQSNQELMQVIAASLQPKTASIKINKLGDGSFVGQRIEE